MAAQSKTTAVHFSLIFFVMLSVILGVVAYLFYADFRENEAKYVKMQADSTAQQTAARRYIEEIAELKKLIGITVEEVGVQNPGDAKSVKAQALAAIQTFGTNPAANDLVTALRDLRTQLDKQTVEMAQRQATIVGLQNEVLALKGQYDAVAKKHDDSRMQTEKDLTGEQQKFQESIVAKDRDLANVRQQLAAVQTEYASTREQMQNTLNTLRTNYDSLDAQNKKLSDDLKTSRGESFEVADGEIIRVDQVARTVWINLGEKDGIRKRTTFSIYPKNNTGIGRTSGAGGRAEDVKGSVEVTRIIDAKLCEARILDDVSSKPISPGDLVYTPLWSAGRIEKFAFVGMIDLDGDGSYLGDRERLHELVESTGAQISAEVNDSGERIGPEIDEQTHFLVIGAIPEFTEEPEAKRKAELRQMSEIRKSMIDEARRHGVNVINLTQFLDFIGFIPQRRLFVPGDSNKFTLDPGGRYSEGRTPSSSGNTSALFGTRRGANPVSSGNTSKVFGGR